MSKTFPKLTLIENLKNDYISVRNLESKELSRTKRQNLCWEYFKFL